MAALVDPKVLAQVLEHRGSGRRRVLLADKLVFGASELTLDCAIRDLSQSGARIRVNAPTIVPAQVHLIELRSGLAFESRVVWRRTPDYGLEFVKGYDLAKATSPELNTLKRIWVECRPR